MGKPDAARVQVVSRAHYGVRPEAFNKWADLNARMKKKPEGAAEIQIYGLILPHEEVTFMRDCFGDETAMSGKMFRDAMSAMEGDVTLRINSDGGDVFEASTMLAAIREHQEAGFAVNAVVDGIAASAASLLACAADRTVMAEMAFIMIHEASGGMYGRSKDMENGAKLLADMNGMAADLYAKRTGMEKEEILRMMDDETFLAAPDAVEMGFAAAIMEVPAEDPEVEMKASMARRNARLSAILQAVNVN